MDKKRSKIIVNSGYLFILTNFLLAIFNILVGMVSNSIAIFSDAIHSLTDTISGILVIVSEKLASHKKFNQKRTQIERTTTIIIAIIIIVIGVHIMIESFEAIIEPEQVDYSPAVIIVLIASIAVKYLLAAYLKNTGKKIKSNVLIASGAETMNDTLISIAVLTSAIIYLIWHIDLEAYLSAIIAIIIIKVGLEFIFPHLSKHHHHHLESDPDHDHCHKK
ncbi:cation diffusion facilitator family transporter [Candidatus Saccharibacteria bacterium]|nr:cation diffusion facilitator family transporter [Candidatus Saccharibacteria bacterium]